MIKNWSLVTGAGARRATLPKLPITNIQFSISNIPTTVAVADSSRQTAHPIRQILSATHDALLFNGRQITLRRFREVIPEARKLGQATIDVIARAQVSYTTRLRFAS